MNDEKTKLASLATLTARTEPGTSLKLDELLARWEAAKAAGQEQTVEQVCAECPEHTESLRRRIDALQAVDEQLRTQSWSKTTQRSFDMCDTSLGEGVVPEIELRFDQLRFLAHGGLGTVFVSRDMKLHRDVVLKSVRSKIADDQSCIDRFLVEAEITSRLDHPGIVPVYGLGRLPDGRPFYAMRYIQGESLDSAIDTYHSTEAKGASIADRALAFRKLLTHFVAGCQTIAYAHRRGIIHRDIKPEHLIMGRYGETLVVDWGLAVPVGREERFKDELEKTLMPQASNPSGSSTDGAGTPHYMSPEQAAGGVSLSPATDIYSLGVTLFKLLTGKVPFKADSLPALRQQILRGNLPAPSKVSADIPEALEAVCLKAVAHEPSKRYATAQDLAVDIERFLADEATSVERDTWSKRLGRWTRRNRSTAQSSMLGLVAVAALAIGAAFLLLRASNDTREARDASLQTSATFASRMLGQEIEARWFALTTAANDPQLHEFLRLSKSEPLNADSKVHKDSVAWLKRRKQETDKVLRSTSWSLFNDEGFQVGRFSDEDPNQSVGKQFQYRAYFHGRDIEYGDGDDVGNLRPLELPYVSPAFLSVTGSKLPRVSFSVPVWSGERVIGVLTMSLTAGEFRALKLDQAEGKQVLLVDARADSARKKDVVLFDSEVDAANQGDAFRYAETLLERLGVSGEVPSGGGLKEHDATIDGGRAGDRIAAWQPVLVHRNPTDAEAKPFGWLVVVQQQD